MSKYNRNQQKIKDQISSSPVCKKCRSTKSFQGSVAHDTNLTKYDDAFKASMTLSNSSYSGTIAADIK